MISGISHLTFIVKDLEKSARFFKAVLGAEEKYASGDKPYSLSKEKFFLLGDIWLCLMEGEPLDARTYNHIAFKVSDEDFDSYVEKIRHSGADVRPGRPRVSGEGRSIYFYDYDNHLFELHTGTLAERLKTYAAR